MDRFRKKYKILVFAFVITLIHAFIPHVHAHGAGEAVIETTESNPDFANLISRVLTFNLGCQHLENFRASDDGADFEAAPSVSELVPRVVTMPDDAHVPVIRQFPLPPNSWLASVNLTRGSPLA